jgi:hypothetical protein
LGVASFILFVLNRDTGVPATWGVAGGSRMTWTDWLNIVDQGLVSPSVSTLLGALIVVHHPRNYIGWLLAITGALLGLMSFVSELTVFMNFTMNPPLAGSGMVALLLNWVWIATYTLVIWMVAVFPNGAFLSAGWRWLISFAVAMFFLPMSMASLLESSLSSAFQVAHPFISQTPSMVPFLFSLAVLFMPLSAVLALGEMALRFRQATSVERQQIKWLLVFIGMMTASLVAGLLLAFASPFRVIGETLVNISVTFPMVGIGVAVLRYRLYDIDVILNRVLVYTMVTAALALIYYGSVVVLQGILTRAGGAQSPMITVLSTLAMAALFNPLRHRVQQVVDRRFYRRKYDAQQALAHFARTTRDETELDVVGAALVQVVEVTVQPAHVSLWVRPWPR